MTITQISGAIDLMPTISALAGVQPVATKPLDGIDLSIELLGGMAPDRRRRIPG